jgi:small subunit ribosomal protein S20
MVTKRKLGSGRHLSAFKRQRQTKKRTEHNKAAKSALRTQIKKSRTNPTAEELRVTTSHIAKTASKGIIPKRRAARLTSRLARAANAAG